MYVYFRISRIMAANLYERITFPQMLTGYSDLAFQFGLADENQAAYINSETQSATKLIMDAKFFEAFQVSLLLN